MSVFRFKKFDIHQSRSAMKIGTDAMVLGVLINADSCRTALDIGAGTGVLSLMVSQNYPDIQIDAIEIDQPSYEECADNFKRSNWSDNLNPVHTDLLEYSTADKFDLIFTNPPFYLKGLHSEDKRRSQARHNEFMPLDKLAMAVKDLLAENGTFICIVPKENETDWLSAFSDLSLRRKIDIYGKRRGTINRVVLELSTGAGELMTSTIIIREPDGSYTNQYKELTKEFHANEL